MVLILACADITFVWPAGKKKEEAQNDWKILHVDQVTDTCTHWHTVTSCIYNGYLHAYIMIYMYYDIKYSRCPQLLTHTHQLTAFVFTLMLGSRPRIQTSPFLYLMSWLLLAHWYRHEFPIYPKTKLEQVMILCRVCLCVCLMCPCSSACFSQQCWYI